MKSVGVADSFYRAQIIDKCKSYWNENISHIDIDTFLEIPTMWNVGIEIF